MNSTYTSIKIEKANCRETYNFYAIDCKLRELFAVYQHARRFVLYSMVLCHFAPFGLPRAKTFELMRIDYVRSFDDQILHDLEM